MSQPRRVSLFRNGRNQAVRIPVEFELPGDEATMRREGDTLVIAPVVRAKTLNEVLDSLEAFPEFADLDDSDLPPLRDISL